MGHYRADYGRILLDQGGKRMSRKTITVVAAVVGAIITFFQSQFGLSISGTAVAGSLAAVLAYVFFEGKMDLRRLQSGLVQGRKWADPAFWVALISAILPVLNTQLGLGLPTETITAGVTFILSVIFGRRLARAE